MSENLRIAGKVFDPGGGSSFSRNSRVRIVRDQTLFFSTRKQGAFHFLCRLLFTRIRSRVVVFIHLFSRTRRTCRYVGAMTRWCGLKFLHLIQNPGEASLETSRPRIPRQDHPVIFRKRR